MSYFFTDTFRQALRNTYPPTSAPSLFPHNVVAYFFPTAPSFSTNDPRYVGVDTVDELANVVGWGPYIGITSAPFAMTQSAPIGRNVYVVFNNPLDIPDTFPIARVRAVAFVYQGTLAGVTNPIMFVTNTPFGGIPQIFRNNDSIVARADTNANSNKWWLGWAIPSGTTIDPTEGPLALLKGAPTFETSHTHHAWMYPQRVNLVANPSFEYGITHWRTDGTLTQVSTPSPGGGYRAGHFTGTGRLVTESNYFPTQIGRHIEPNWTIQAMIKGSGKVRIGLVSWPADFREPYTDWGDEGEIKDLGSGSFLHLYALRKIGDAEVAQVRIEVKGALDTTPVDMVLDNVCCEPDFLLGWPYFDGDTTYGGLDDFSWYPDTDGTVHKGKTFSLWYNHRRAVGGRLFAWSIAETDPTITDEEVAKQGYVYEWVPAGTRVRPHWDVLYAGDVHQPVSEVAGSPVTDIDDPWIPADTEPPSKPLNLVATATPVTVDLSWDASTDNVGVDHYVVERCQGAGCTVFGQVHVGTATSFNDSGLLPVVSYSYRVYAVDPSGNNSPYSDIITVVTESHTSTFLWDDPGALWDVAKWEP